MCRGNSRKISKDYLGFGMAWGFHDLWTDNGKYWAYYLCTTYVFISIHKTDVSGGFIYHHIWEYREIHIGNIYLVDTEFELNAQAAMGVAWRSAVDHALRLWMQQTGLTGRIASLGSSDD
jgi:hypothetical protein